MLSLIIIFILISLSLCSITFVYPSSSTDICQVQLDNSFNCIISFISTNNNSYTLNMINLDLTSVTNSKSYTFNANITSTNSIIYEITYPIAYGNYLINLYDNDQSISYTQQFIVVAELLNILSPNSTTEWRGGSTHTIEWTRYPSTSHTVSISYSLDAGSTYTSIASLYNALSTAYISNSSAYTPSLSLKYYYTWTLPTTLNGNLIIKIVDSQQPSYPLITPSFTISNCIVL